MNKGFSLKTVSIRELNLWKENYRHERMETENEILNWFINNDTEHTLTLAKDILDNGILEPPAVIQENNKYIIRDGNRRCSVLKMLLTPDLINDEHSRERIKKIQERAAVPVQEELGVLVYNSEDDIQELIVRRHNGVDGGRGLEPWKTEAKDRMREDRGETTQNTRANAVLKYLKDKNLINDVQESMGSKRTNWERFLSHLSDYFKLKDESVFCNLSEESLVSILQKMLQDLNSQKIFSHISKNQFLEIYNPIIQEEDKVEEWPLNANRESAPLNSNEASALKAKPKKRGRGPNKPKPLTIIDDSEFNLEGIDSDMIKNLFWEMSNSSKINSENAPYCTAAAIRVLFECIFAGATEKRGLTESYKVALEMFDKDDNTKKDKDYVNALKAETKDFIKILHSGVHAVEYQPTCGELKQHWDNHKKLIKFCLGKIRAKTDHND